MGTIWLTIDDKITTLHTGPVKDNYKKCFYIVKSGVVDSIKIQQADKSTDGSHVAADGFYTSRKFSKKLFWRPNFKNKGEPWHIDENNSVANSGPCGSGEVCHLESHLN